MPRSSNTKQFLLRPLTALVALQLGLAPLAAYAQTSEFDVQRVTAQRAAVKMAAYQLATQASNLDGDPYQETPAFLTGSGGPADGGIIPDGFGIPRTDGYGAYLGYCAWDNGTSTGMAGHLPGGTGNDKPVFAVVSYGLNNTFESSCASIAATGNPSGDDYVYWFSVGDTSYTSNSNILGSQYWRDAVDDLATLNALTTGINGEIRFVRADSSLWQFNGTTWNEVRVGGVAGDGSGNAIAAQKLAVGQAAVGAEQLYVNGGAGAALGLQSSGARTGGNLYNGLGVQTGFLGYDNTNGYLLAESLSGPIVFRAGGAERFRIGADGSLSQNGTVVLDATRNLVNLVNGTFSGTVTANQFNAANGYQVGGSTVIDASRNAAVAALTASGNATVAGTLGVTGLLTAGSGINTTTLTATGAVNGGSGSFSGALSAGSLSAGAITATGLLSANGGIATSNLSSGGQLAFTGNYAGTAASPALAFTGTNYTGGTGLYSPGSNALGLATAGVSRLAISNTGVVAISGATTIGGKLTTAASAAGGAGLNLPHGAAPTTPANGDLWTTTGGLYTRINGATKQVADLDSTQLLTNKTIGAGSVWNGGVIANSYLPNSGQLTVTAGTGLTGGGAVALGGNTTLNLANTAVTAGTYGSATTSPTFTVDAQGRLTAASSVTITPAWANITSKPAAITSYAINMDQNVRTTDTPTFAKLFLTQVNAGAELGAASAANTPYVDFHSSGNNIDYDARIIALGGSAGTGAGALQMLAAGGVTFNGKVTTVASAAGAAGLNLPHGAAPSAPTNGDIWTTTAGLHARINGATVQMADTASNQTLTNKTIGAGSTWNGNDIANAYLTNNGQLTVTAGTGLTGGGAIALGGAATLALANTAVAAGAYGSATTSPTFTVDAQGRLTAASSVTIAPAWGSVTGKPTTVAGYGMTDLARGDSGAADLNTLVTSGFYRINGANPNRPAEWGQMLTIMGGGDTVTQIYGAYSTGTLYTRSGNPPNVGGGGSWTPWRTVMDNNNSQYAYALNQYLRATDAPSFAGLTLTGGLSGTTASFSGALSAASLTTTGNVAIGGALAVTGTSTFSGMVSANGGLTAAGKVTTAASTAGSAGFNLPHGAAPTAPVNGDLWSTATGLYSRINGATVQLADLASVQTLTNKTLGAGSTWSGNAIVPVRGGTGLTTAPASGQLMIGKSDGTYVLAYLQGTANHINVLSGSGTIQLSLPQPVHSGASPSFAALTLAGNSAVGGALSVAGASTLTGLLTANGGVTATTFAASGDASVGGALTVTGDVTTSGKITAGKEIKLATVGSNGVAVANGNACTAAMKGAIATDTNGDVFVCK